VTAIPVVFPSCIRVSLCSAASLLLAMAAGCTDSGLEPIREGVTTYDDELHLHGEVCLTAPEDASFPVKILFLVDISDSMRVTDMSFKRAQAVVDVINRYGAQPAVFFGVISFNSGINKLTDGFTRSPDPGTIQNGLSQHDRLTDYQGALGAAYQMISADAVASSVAQRARSKYVIVFFSDGTPDPQCSSRETPCGAGTCPAHQHCRATVCKDDYLICTTARKDWQDAFDPPIPEDMYPELDKGADYNQPSQILRAVDDIIGLQDFYHLGEVRMHTAFLYDPEAASSPLAAPFGLDRAGGVELMTAMAEHGLGTFTEFSDATKIDFLSINYTSFKEKNGLAMVLATNLNAVDTGAGRKADTDGDGLVDEAEAGLTCVGHGPSCSDPADSDGDGYTDLFEERNRVSGFDPLDGKKPLTPCSSKSDRDNDLLRDCEEEFLKTDPKNPDSDADRIPDGIEFRAGMDPLDPSDAFADPDRDGERNLDEIKGHTDPQVASTSAHPVVRYLYDVAPFTKTTGEECFSLDVRHIKLMTTGRGTDSPVGVNRVYLYFGEAPLGRALDPGSVRVACADVRYMEGAWKSPASGTVAFKPDGDDLPDFHPVMAFNPAEHCLDHTNDAPPDPDAGTAGGGP
jgi:hypothetical protein